MDKSEDVSLKRRLKKRCIIEIYLMSGKYRIPETDSSVHKVSGHCRHVSSVGSLRVPSLAGGCEFKLKT